MNDLFEILEVVKESVRQAGQAVFRIAQDGFETAYKQNKDPVTTADLEADRILKTALLGHYPQSGWLSEETVDDPSRLQREWVWIVDPIDGTKEFVTGIPEYAVSVALSRAGTPVAAAIYNPAADKLFTAISGHGVWLNDRPITVKNSISNPPVILASRSEVKRGQFKPFEQHAKIQPCGSIAYKLALVAAGLADATFSLGPKNEWDIAAGVLMVSEAGGKVASVDNQPFTFNREQTLVNGIVATSACAERPIRDMIENCSNR